MNNCKPAFAPHMPPVCEYDIGHFQELDKILSSLAFVDRAWAIFMGTYNSFCPLIINSVWRYLSLKAVFIFILSIIVYVYNF